MGMPLRKEGFPEKRGVPGPSERSLLPATPLGTPACPVTLLLLFPSFPLLSPGLAWLVWVFSFRRNSAEPETPHVERRGCGSGNHGLWAGWGSEPLLAVGCAPVFSPLFCCGKLWRCGSRVACSLG